MSVTRVWQGSGIFLTLPTLKIPNLQVLRKHSGYFALWSKLPIREVP